MSIIKLVNMLNNLFLTFLQFAMKHARRVHNALLNYGVSRIRKVLVFTEAQVFLKVLRQIYVLYGNVFPIAGS